MPRGDNNRKITQAMAVEALLACVGAMILMRGLEWRADRSKMEGRKRAA